MLDCSNHKISPLNGPWLSSRQHLQYTCTRRHFHAAEKSSAQSLTLDSRRILSPSDLQFEYPRRRTIPNLPKTSTQSMNMYHSSFTIPTHHFRSCLTHASVAEAPSSCSSWSSRKAIHHSKDIQPRLTFPFCAAYKDLFNCPDSIWAAGYGHMSSVTATLGDFASQYTATSLRAPEIFECLGLTWFADVGIEAAFRVTVKL